MVGIAVAIPMALVMIPQQILVKQFSFKLISMASIPCAAYPGLTSVGTKGCGKNGLWLWFDHLQLLLLLHN